MSTLPASSTDLVSPGAGMSTLDGPDLVRVAEWFQALAEPTRLQILNLLRQRPHNVGELAQLCGCSAANVSRHLDRLARNGFVHRQTKGTTVFYGIADPAIYAMCDMVCGQIARQLHEQAARHGALLPKTGG